MSKSAGPRCSIACFMAPGKPAGSSTRTPEDNLAAHAHRTAAMHQGQEEHLTGHEHSRQALEHSNTAYQHSLGMHQKATTDHVVIVRAQEAREEGIPVLAYNL